MPPWRGLRDFALITGNDYTTLLFSISFLFNNLRPMDWMDIRNLVKRNHALGLCSLVFVRYGYGFNIHFLGFFLKEAERYDMISRMENLNKSRKKEHTTRRAYQKTGNFTILLEVRGSLDNLGRSQKTILVKKKKNLPSNVGVNV